MMNVLLRSTVFAVGVSQALSPLRVGDVAQQLSAQDVVDIERAGSAAGSPPWLLVSVRGQIVGLQSVAMYLAPEAATNELRRGRMVELVRVSLQANIASTTRLTPGVWTVKGTGNYAQVRVADRDFDRIEDDRDVNRPFQVEGKFDDVELVSLVRFLRSSPMGPTPDARTATGPVHGEWPIERLVRQSTSVDIDLIAGRLEWERVRLHRQGPDWVILSIGRVFA
jgi:hypothetical protein